MLLPHLRMEHIGYEEAECHILVVSSVLLWSHVFDVCMQWHLHASRRVCILEHNR